MSFYAEVKGFDGRWCPVKYAEEPPTKRADGGKIEYRVVREIEPDEEHLTLEDLFQKFAPNGRLYAMNREKQDA